MGAMMLIDNFLRILPTDHPTHRYYKWLKKRLKKCSTKPLKKKELKQVRKWLKDAGVQPAAKQCYYVSQMVALASGGKIRYFEGVATGAAIPVEHAWLVYKGKVVDFVWATLNHLSSPDGASADPNVEYMGTEIDLQMVAEHIMEYETAAPAIATRYAQETGIAS